MGIWIKPILFAVGTAGLLWVSRTSLKDQRYHGFYRFFTWEAILILFLINVDDWFAQPFSPRQITSWVLLCVSLGMIFAGVLAFRKSGKISAERLDDRLVGIEKTTGLVTSGVYHYIRHPFYSSLLFLGWGIFLKRVDWVGLGLAVFINLMLYITARMEEVEDIQYFGEEYRTYMHKTKRFVPFLF